jgi:hypothetical protein
MIAAVVMALMLMLSTARAQSSEGSTADGTARFLAGLPPSSNSPLAVLTKNSAWLSHARHFDQIFAKSECSSFQGPGIFEGISERQTWLRNQPQSALALWFKERVNRNLTSLKEKLDHDRRKGRKPRPLCVAFQIAEVAIPRQMFQEILRLIAELRPQPPPAPA